MNRRQKIVQQRFLNNEEAVIKRLRQVYAQSSKDIDEKIEELMKRFDPETGELPPSVVYQLQYQQQLKAQVDAVLKDLQTKQYTTVAAYLDECYTDGFVGGLYDLQGQGVPFMMPIDQQAMVHAVQLESKISKGLYTRLGEDVDMLKKKITAEVSRSISTGESFDQTAKRLRDQTSIGYNRAVRIARTEGHRIQCTAAMDVMHGAKERGADVVKQWDATLDAKTRDSHADVDGEIREVDEPFSNKLMFPGDPQGSAGEVINCRCAILQRARWALVEKVDPLTGEYTISDGSFTKIDGFTDEIRDFKDQKTYNEFKKDYFSKENRQYMNYVTGMEEQYRTRDVAKLLDKLTDSEYQRYLDIQAKRPAQFPKVYRSKPFQPATPTPKAPKKPVAKFAPDYSCPMATEYGKAHYDALNGFVENCPDELASTVWKNYESQVKVGDAHYKGTAHASGYTVSLDIDKVANGDSISTPYQTAFHEGGHAIDSLARGKVQGGSIFARHYSSAYKDGLFPQTIKDEVQELVKERGERIKAEFKAHAGDVEWFRANGYMYRWQSTPPKYSKSLAYSALEKEIKLNHSLLARGDLSDILEGATGAKIQCGVGHGASYWRDRTIDGIPDGLATEAFAEMMDSTFANPESLEMIKKYLPKSYSVFQDMLEDLK
jgi:SPP1 gp7 family putative phage head morphogenesis protein